MRTKEEAESVISTACERINSHLGVFLTVKQTKTADVEREDIEYVANTGQYSASVLYT